MSLAQQFVEAMLRQPRPRAAAAAKHLGGRQYDSVDNIYQFYEFPDGSKAGVKPAKPKAIKAGKEYQAWVVE